MGAKYVAYQSLFQLDSWRALRSSAYRVKERKWVLTYGSIGRGERWVVKAAEEVRGRVSAFSNASIAKLLAYPTSTSHQSLNHSSKQC